MEKLVGAKRSVLLECLGLCEHCETPLSFGDMPIGAIDVEWKCSSCEGLLTNQTFGIEEIEGKWEKTKWVGPGAQWTDEQPNEDFTIDNWLIVTSPLPRGPLY